MRVVFLDDVDGVARAGEIKNVADGYARNFLLPRKLAAVATASTVQQAEKRARQLEKEQEKLDAAAQGMVATLSKSPIVIEARAGDQGRLFGSVTASDIAEAVNARAGSKIEHRQVALAQPIKELGIYEVSVSLTRNVRAQVTVEVQGEGGVTAAQAAPQAPAGDDAADDEDDED
jgi:large subunit ribosomal protein L9